ncbi:hypothetical protein NDU88_000656 [Pleurodeles waltl]|uniref:Uncharacterized protein n=1 Tax=Pleurodeles waltl TaxID=8319 RepID=A0AAV7Q3H9_PLEWA|nr:hypothetical protein NDU88_000656 [Pleurodeles waltl]
MWPGRTPTSGGGAERLAAGAGGPGPGPGGTHMKRASPAQEPVSSGTDWAADVTGQRWGLILVAAVCGPGPRLSKASEILIRDSQGPDTARTVKPDLGMAAVPRHNQIEGPFAKQGGNTGCIRAP